MVVTQKPTKTANLHPGIGSKSMKPRRPSINPVRPPLNRNMPRRAVPVRKPSRRFKKAGKGM